MRRGLIFEYYKLTDINPVLITERKSIFTSSFVWSRSTYDDWYVVSLEWYRLIEEVDNVK